MNKLFSVVILTKLSHSYGSFLLENSLGRLIASFLKSIMDDFRSFYSELVASKKSKSMMTLNLLVLVVIVWKLGRFIYNKLHKSGNDTEKHIKK